MHDKFAINKTHLIEQSGKTEKLDNVFKRNGILNIKALKEMKIWFY